MDKKHKYWRIIFICSLTLAAVVLVFRNSESLNLDFISSSPPDKLRVGVVQMDPRPTLEENRDYIIERISGAAKKNVRVVVFPEGALRGTGAEDPDKVDEAVGAIRKAAAEFRLYVLFDGFTYSEELKKNTNWMLVVDPSGNQLFRYDKLYNNHHAPMPGVFLIDDIPCSAIICADRWLRGVEEIPIQQGAKISFELSNNYAEEWVEPLQWYWYVPRALRNNVWVVLANSGNRAGKFSDSSSASVRANHGHSAIIAPDGSFADRAADDRETMLVADIDVSLATRAEALARSGHPVLRQFWEAGLKLQAGQPVDTVSFTPLRSEKTEVTIAVAQVTGKLSVIENMVRKAKARKADIVVFPARTISGSSVLEDIQDLATAYAITIVFGMEHQLGDGLRNSAFVIGPDGSVLTRYDQLSAEDKYQPGMSPASMWFRVKGVPAVVTVGRDALWSELAELAAVAGAQIHIHLQNDPVNTPEANLKRLQIWANMASFRTFTAVANVHGSTLWEDLYTSREIHSVMDRTPRPVTGAIEIFSPWSANLIMQAKTDSLIVASRPLPGFNNYHPRWTSNFNPQMENWYRIGARVVQSDGTRTMKTY